MYIFSLTKGLVNLHIYYAAPFMLIQQGIVLLDSQALKKVKFVSQMKIVKIQWEETSFVDAQHQGN